MFDCLIPHFWKKAPPPASITQRGNAHATFEHNHMGAGRDLTFTTTATTNHHAAPANVKSLVNACRRKNVALVEKYLEETFHDNDAVNYAADDDPKKDTALHVATEVGSSKLVELLLSCDQIDVNITNAEGATPLLIAVDKKYGSIVTLLLARQETDVNARWSGRYDITPLIAAVQNDDEAIVRSLLGRSDIDPDLGYENESTGSGGSALVVAADGGSAGIIRLLLEDPRVDPNGRNHGGSTALHLASGGGHADIVKLLLTHKKINPNAQNGEDITPLMQASMWGKEDVVRVLLGHKGVKLNMKTEEGRYGKTALTYASEWRRKEVEKLLRNNGAK